MARSRSLLNEINACYNTTHKPPAVCHVCRSAKDFATYFLSIFRMLLILIQDSIEVMQYETELFMKYSKNYEISSL